MQATLEIGNRQDIRDNAVRAGEINGIELSKVIIREDFNARKDYGDIEGLAESILQNGQTQPGRVDVVRTDKGVKFALVDGHRRFKALQLLEARGESIKFVAIVNTKETTEQDRLIQMFTTQDNKQLEPLEAANIIQRLLTSGLKQKEIGEKIGRSGAWVSGMIKLALIANSSQETKEAITDKKASATEVVKIARQVKSPAKAAEVINAQVRSGTKVKAAPSDNSEVHSEEFEGMTLQEACAKDLCEQFPSIPYGVVLTIISKHFKQKN